jgi:hypothetical protein
MNELTKSLLINVIHAHLLCLTFDELAVERRVEERRVEAYQLFVNDEFLFGRCLRHGNSDELSRFARIMDGRVHGRGGVAKVRRRT